MTVTETGLIQMCGRNEEEENEINQNDTDKMHCMKWCPTALKKKKKLRNSFKSTQEKLEGTAFHALDLFLALK